MDGKGCSSTSNEGVERSANNMLAAIDHANVQQAAIRDGAQDQGVAGITIPISEASQKILMYLGRPV